MASYIIPSPLRQLMAERDSMTIQLNNLKEEFQLKTEERAQTIEQLDRVLDVIKKRTTKLTAEIAQYDEAIKTMQAQFQIPADTAPAPNDSGNTTV